VRDEPGMQEAAHLAGVAAGRVPVVVGDKVAQGPCVPGLGEFLRLGHERVQLLLGRARVFAGRAGEGREEHEATQGVPPSAAACP